jgi:hypothetical protein
VPVPDAIQSRTTAPGPPLPLAARAFPESANEIVWPLRDIRAKRWKLVPIDPSHLRTLMETGLVEVRSNEPTLTNAGLDS